MTPAIEPFVHVGTDGWLFLQGGSNFVASLYQREGGQLPDRQLALWRDVIARRARRFARLGIDWLFVVVPEKLTIYAHRTASPLVDPDLAPAVRLYEQLEGVGAQGHMLDLVTPMRRARDEQDLYWRTDTHWSPAGCFLAYELICERLGVKVDAGLLSRPFQEYSRVMDLGGHIDPMPWETVRSYDYLRGARRRAVNRVTRYLEDPQYDELVHVGARAWFQNPGAPNPQRVMLIGDSYALPSATRLTGMMAETFRSVEFVWSNSIDWQAVRWRRPDIVICEIAERFLMLPPHDGMSWKLQEWRQARRARRIRADRRQAGPP